MIERDYLNGLIEINAGSNVSSIPPDVFNELCRVYFAWLEAPEVIWDYMVDYGGDISFPTEKGLRSFDDFDGKRVRLVEVKDG